MLEDGALWANFSTDIWRVFRCSRSLATAELLFINSGYLKLLFSFDATEFFITITFLSHGMIDTRLAGILCLKRDTQCWTDCISWSRYNRRVNGSLPLQCALYRSRCTSSTLAHVIPNGIILRFQSSYRGPDSYTISSGISGLDQSRRRCGTVTYCSVSRHNPVEVFLHIVSPLCRKYLAPEAVTNSATE